MAFFAVRPGGRLDIRESVATPAGPRSRTLASFRGALTPEVLERAERRAARPFDRARVLARAAALGVPTTERREDRAARTLLASLRAGGALDPALAAALRRELQAHAAAPPPAELADVAEWVGVGPEARGRALRDLLRLSDRIARSRRLPRTREAPRFPRFRSRRRRALR
jgi:hypothetical protein